MLQLLRKIVLGIGFALGTLGNTDASGPTDGYGMYDSACPSKGTVAENCFPRLDRMSQGGMKLVMNYVLLNGDAAGILAYLDHADSKGMKVIVPMHNPSVWANPTADLRSIFPDLAATSKATDNKSFIAYVVNLLKGHPALWGYYIGDELDPAQHDQLKGLTDLIKQLDPNHPRLIVQGGDDPIEKIVTPMVDTADVLGVDWYPVGSWATKHFVAQTGQVARDLQQIVDHQVDKQSAMVLQTFSWSQFPKEEWRYPPLKTAPYPTLAELKSMLAQTFANSNPRIVLWYSYPDLLKSDDPTGHWKDLVEAMKSTSSCLSNPAGPSGSSDNK